jgi:hypothetical protein
MADSKLSAAEVKDEADTSPRVVTSDLSGERVRAIPAKGGTTVIVNAKDFTDHGIDHPAVTWDFRLDSFTVEVGVGKAISKEAADFLTKNYPQSFEYMSK